MVLSHLVCSSAPGSSANCGGVWAVVSGVALLTTPLSCILHLPLLGGLPEWMPRIAGSIDGDRLDQLRGGREGVGDNGGTLLWWSVVGVWRSWVPCGRSQGGEGVGWASSAHEHSVMCVGWVHACYSNAGNILIRAC